LSATDKNPVKHTIIDWRKHSTLWSYDDEITINTQAGSQWDGLRHWGHSEYGLYYQGIHHDDLWKGDHIGLDHWNDRGGIVGRGVLIDYVSWAEKQGIKYDAWDRHSISVGDIETIAKEQNVKFLPGDVLLVRTGWIKRYESAGEEERQKGVAGSLSSVGVEGCKETMEFLWNSRFSAVAGDSIGFEAWPGKKPYIMHDHLLSMWGMVSHSTDFSS